MDGVLNSSPSKKIRNEWKNRYGERLYLRKLYGIDPDLVKYIKNIIDNTNCKIVFSTSWRYYKNHPVEGSDWRQNLLELLGTSSDIFVGNIPDLSCCDGWGSGTFRRNRGYEIKWWLDNNTEPGKYSYCILDDEIKDILTYIDKSHVVQTDNRIGISFENSQNAIKILNKE